MLFASVIIFFIALSATLLSVGTAINAASVSLITTRKITHLQLFSILELIGLAILWTAFYAVRVYA
jgi:hypothetical protein